MRNNNQNSRRLTAALVQRTPASTGRYASGSAKRCTTLSESGTYQNGTDKGKFAPISPAALPPAAAPGLNGPDDITPQIHADPDPLDHSDPEPNKYASMTDAEVKDAYQKALAKSYADSLKNQAWGKLKYPDPGKTDLEDEFNRRYPRGGK